MYFGTEKTLYNHRQHIFKHLVSFVCRLVNFSSREIFFITKFRAVSGRIRNFVFRQQMVGWFCSQAVDDWLEGWADALKGG